jgi:hypothetical protein
MYSPFFFFDVYMQWVEAWTNVLSYQSVTKGPAVILYITEERRAKLKKRHLRRLRLGY